LTLRIAFLASNNGTSFRAVVECIEEGGLNAAAVLLVTNRKTSSALAYAEEHRIAHRYIPTRDREHEADLALLDALREVSADLVILSGYLRKIGPGTLKVFEGRVLNVHPSLLPAYGGQGMYGRRVHEAVLADRTEVSGATVHLVDAEYDHGRTIAAREVMIEPGWDVERLEQEVMLAERSLFTEIVRKLAEGELQLPL
jgi:phosphoribosylglycinamide formyltransferase 1